MLGISLSTVDFAAAALTFTIGLVFALLDLCETVFAGEIRTINLLRSSVIWLFLLLNALLGTMFFLVSCTVPDGWIYRFLGQGVENSFGRAVTVGIMVTVILRSKLSSLPGGYSLGIDPLYAIVRRQALVALSTKSERVFRNTAANFAIRMRDLVNVDSVLRDLAAHAKSVLQIAFHDNPDRRRQVRSRLNARFVGLNARLIQLNSQYTGIIQGEIETTTTSTIAEREEIIRDVIYWSCCYAGYKEVTRWLEERLDKERIEARAHRIWQDEGRLDGHHVEHWERARDELEKEELLNLGRFARLLRTAVNRTKRKL